jgi:uncharacterized protein
MSQENVDKAAAAFQALNAEGVPAFVSFLHEDVEWRQDERSVEPGTYYGHDGVRKFYERVHETFPDFTAIPERYVDAGDRVVVYLRVSGSGPSSGITIDNDVAGLLTFRDGKIAEYQIYLDRSEALKAAQLTDRDVAS